MRFNPIFIYGLLVCFLGMAVFGLVYVFLKLRDRSDAGSSAPVLLPEKGEEEKRKEPRTDIHWPVSIETPEGAIDGEARNISLSGAFICCKTPFPLKKIIRLTLIVPGNEPIPATAQVVWSNVNVPDKNVVHRGMGVRFINPSKRQIEIIRQLFPKSH
jgi:hypothetical protein